MTATNVDVRSRLVQESNLWPRFSRMVKLPRPAEPEPELPELELSPRTAAWIRLFSGLRRLARLSRIWSALGYHLRIIKERGRDAA